MIIRLTGENFEFHYGFVNWRDKIILDIGADIGSTAECFLAYGANKVYAVEGDDNFYNHLIEYATGKQIFPIKKWINNPEDFIYLFNNFKVDLIKIDCEGCEIHFLDIPENIIKLTNEYVIECHTRDISSKILNKLISADFHILTVKDLNDIINVIHAVRK